MKKELIQSIEREKKISLVAIEHLKNSLKSYEEKYGWSTEEFLDKFENGIAGDDTEFFRWYSLIKALEDWNKTKDALEEALAF